MQMTTLQEQKSVSFMDEVNADFAGAKVGPPIRGICAPWRPATALYRPSVGIKKPELFSSGKMAEEGQ